MHRPAHRANPRRRTASLVVLAACMAFATCAVDAGAQLYESRVADANRVALTVTSYGFLGNNWTTRSPSFVYAQGVGSVYEHLPRGGLWIGAHGVDADGPFTGVTTACLDGTAGMAPQGATEFTPDASPMVVRSTLLSSPDYSPDAISEHDVIARFHDGVPKRSADNSEPHRPLGLVVRQDSYQWSVAPLGDVIFLRYVIRTASPLTDVWVGVYTEFVSVNQSAQSVWPPSGAYHRSLLEYDAALRLLREHYCAGQPVPAGCQFATVPYWVGLESLTPPDPSLGQQTTIDGWQWGPQSPLRDTDAERYAIMSSGTARDWTLPDVMPGTGDPTELVAIGPYAALVPGDSIVVDFALLGGADVADIQRQAYDAQRARDLGFRDVPTPVLASVVDAQAEPGRVTVSWTVTDGLRDARIERRTDASPWAVLAAALPDASGAVRFDDRDVVPGTRYGYRLAAGSVTAGEAWVDVPGAAELAILPMGSDVDAGAALRVDYVLPAGTPAELRLVDVTGRVCATRALAAVRGRGAAELPCPGGPGVYWLRLAQGPRAVSRSVVVVR